MTQSRAKLIQTVASAGILAVILIVSAMQRQNDPPPAAPAGRSSAPAAVDPIGFRSRAALEEHFRKHGREFGRNVTIDQYLHLAQVLRDAPAGGAILQQTRGDGVSTRFDRASGAFGAYNRDRTIRTFFKPNDGEAYFRRQLDREPEEE